MSPSVNAEDEGIELFGKLVSEMQSNVEIRNGEFLGTLKFIEGGIAQSGPLAGDGYFVALKFGSIDTEATSIRVGLDPSMGSGLVEIITDPDKNGVFKITDPTTQVFKTVTTDGANTITKTYDLSKLILIGG